MRSIIDNPTYMTYAEMEEKYIGKWIMVANSNYSPYQELLGGIPLAVADSVLEGQSDGFYDRFKAPQYSPISFRDFDYDSVPDIMGFFHTLEVAGEEDDNNN
ncbi:MAG: hypothetical protein FWC16_08385 [Defluviitaleaceae bacterium]|nr:hypothetical protein [Defluviitaleaceae bacterium]MCL2274927.1 hypothetical protein [Defluviitaleaceae bacterium]